MKDRNAQPRRPIFELIEQGVPKESFIQIYRDTNSVKNVKNYIKTALFRLKRGREDVSKYPSMEENTAIDSIVKNLKIKKEYGSGCVPVEKWGEIYDALEQVRKSRSLQPRAPEVPSGKADPNFSADAYFDYCKRSAKTQIRTAITWMSKPEFQKEYEVEGVMNEKQFSAFRQKILGALAMVKEGRTYKSMSYEQKEEISYTLDQKVHINKDNLNEKLGDLYDFLRRDVAIEDGLFLDRGKSACRQRHTKYVGSSSSGRSVPPYPQTSAAAASEATQERSCSGDEFWQQWPPGMLFAPQSLAAAAAPRERSSHVQRLHAAAASEATQEPPCSRSAPDTLWTKCPGGMMLTPQSSAAAAAPYEGDSHVQRLQTPLAARGGFQL